LADRRQSRSYRSIGDVVAALRDRYPDVSPSSLRFLEREGLLTPQRTGGGHRVYSEQDIDRVMLIKEWQRQRLSLGDIRDRLAASDRLANPAAISERFLEQALGRDLSGAFQTVVAADDLGIPLVIMFGEVLAPALREVGDRWQHGQLLVAQEKEVSELTRDIIAELSWRHAPPEPYRPSIVAGCIPGERHELGLRMVCGLLRADGWAVHYLGADVDAGFLLDAIRLHQPIAVLLSVSLERHLPAMRDTVTRIRAEIPEFEGPPVIVGGPAVREHQDDLRGMGITLVDNLDPGRAVVEIETMLQESLPSGPQE
jgi:DNA-binding transcriptional MerR regulator